MLQFSPLRTAAILIIAAAAIFLSLPNFLSPEMRAALTEWVPMRSLVLGLDLRGGSHLLMQVNRQEVVDERLADLRRDARSILANERGIGNIITTVGNGIEIELTDPARIDEAREALAPLTVGLPTSILGMGQVQDVVIGQTRSGKLSLTLTDEGIAANMSTIVSQSIEVVRRRIDELGTTEPTIQRQGADRILVQVPGFEDSEHLKEIISRTARMTFHLVYPNLTAAQARLQGLPAGTVIVPSSEGGEELIYDESPIGGEDLQDAQAAFDQQRSQWVVTFRFNTRGGITFSEITSQNVGRRFAIVLDGTSITAPQILSPITGGSGQIQGSFTAESATDLAVLLRAGALPATLNIIEERSVGPSLGADSVRGGVIAGIISAAATLGFMIVAYGMFGIFANIALILNITMIVGLLSVLGATLTLPGIAGIVLTLGMAVDANVLIYERIREERAGGRSIVASIEAGFNRAMSAILDSNVTTLIAAVVLFFLGSGPVQGFAVTLALGVMTTLFTAYFVTRLIIAFWYARRRPKEIRIQLVKFIPDNTKIPFMSWRKIALAFSVVASLASIGWFAVGGFNLGIDFKGGSAIEVQNADGPADPGRLRELVGALDLGDVQVQGFGTPEDALIRIELQPGGDAAQQEAIQQVGAVLADEGYEIRRTESISGTVSAELVAAGVVGFSIAILGVLAYLWFRFEWQFAVGAVVSTFHDVVLTIGLFAATGIEFNQSSIAAILTIVGYSLNDTVVVYDRVREYMRKFRKIPLDDLLDLSMNSTLSRTVLTGPTAFMALLALVVFGGEVIRSFTISMLFGVVVGTYSSIFIAAPLLKYLGLKNRPEQAEKPAADKRTDGASV